VQRIGNLAVIQIGTDNGCTRWELSPLLTFAFEQIVDNLYVDGFGVRIDQIWRRAIGQPGGESNMEQKYDGTIPHAEIKLEGRRLVRSQVLNDWGLRLQWEIRRDGKVIATPPARAETSYEHPDATPGTYEVVLQMWKYVDYRKNPEREFINSKYVDVSNKVTYTI
jgi:hypothetical protein